jgi:hypothetical protein
LVFAALHPFKRKSEQDKNDLFKCFLSQPRRRRFRSSPFLGRLRRGAFVVPSEDYSHEPPLLRGLASVQGDRPKTNSQARVLRKKNTMKNQNSNTGLQSRSEQSVGEPAKFIIISIQGREQVVAFPFEIQHVAMLDKIQRQHGDVKPISAGFFLGYSANLWVGGESMTLDLKSRPQDAELIRAFLASPQPQFNFINGGAK